MNNTKAFYLSKTFWVNLLGCIAMAVPVVNAFLQAHPTAMVEAFAGVNLLLRLVTNTGLSIS